MSLKDHITNDPDARGYAGMTDQQVADDLNTLRRNASRQMQIEDILAISVQRGDSFLAGLLQMKAEGVTTLGSSTASMLYDRLSNGDTLDVNETWVQQLSSTMRDNVSVTEWDAADHTALVAFANNQQSDADFYGFGRVKVGHVETARS